MGAAVSQAAGFYHAHKHLEKPLDIVATIGDSTFFHAGVPALIAAVSQNVRFVLVILDNRTTAMTGNQPTPATLDTSGGVDIETLVQGCGVKFCRVADPYDVEEFISLVKEAVEYSRASGPAVVVARHPCLLDRQQQDDTREKKALQVTDDCDGCGYCIQHFECPAMSQDEETQQVSIDPMLCDGCGVCLSVCRTDSIQPVE